MTRRAATLAAADPALSQRWKDLGGRIVLIQPPHRAPEEDRDGALTVADVDGAYTAWYDQHGCESAVVRPDWYLFGAAAEDAGMWRLVDQITIIQTPPTTIRRRDRPAGASAV